MTEPNKSPLVTAVNKLTAQATELLCNYKDTKELCSANATQAKISAKTALDSKKSSLDSLSSVNKLTDEVRNAKSQIESETNDVKILFEKVTAQANNAIANVNEISKVAKNAIDQVDTSKELLSNINTKVKQANVSVDNATEQQKVIADQVSAAKSQAAISTKQAVIAAKQAFIATEQNTEVLKNALLTKECSENSTKQANIATYQADHSETRAKVATTQAGIATVQAVESGKQSAMAAVSADTATKQADLATKRAYQSISQVLAAKIHADRAQLQASIATVQAEEAKNQVEKSKKQVSLATTQAVLAKTSADKAKEVTGMDTAQQLVDVAVTEGFVPVQAQIDAVQADTKLPIVHAPLDNKLSLHAGIGEPVFVKSSDKTITVPAQNITVGAETVTIPAQDIVVAGESIEVPDIQQIKFSRACSAWLDGKEYEADEPRYTRDGKLLVESQSTNGCKWSLDATNENNFFAYGNSDALTYANVGQSPFDPIGINAVRVVNTSTSVQTPRLNYTTSNAGYIAGDQLTMSVFIKDFDFTTTSLTAWSGAEGFVSLDFATDTVIPKNETNAGKIERLANGWVRVSLTYIFNANFGGSRLYAGLGLPAKSTVTMCGWQVEKGDTATSYIPIGSISSGPTVTRAADIATINGKNTVTRWENDQQPIDTDTPRLLANGEHDMSADCLFKFERSTSAWLNGKEYVAGEPRYVGGKLLVEPQSTNLGVMSRVRLGDFALTSSKVNSFLYTCNSHGWSQDVQFFGSGLGLIVGKPYTLSCYLTSSVDASVWAGFHGWNNIGDGVSVSLKAGVRQLVTCTVDAYSASFGEVSFFDTDSSTVFNVGDTVRIESPQVEAGLVATSYIPTTTTAVTRTADYAHVISKAAINTPAGLLPIGEHSVEPTAIRSFKRDTIAWLDGVEYPANTPRYLPNGQLLIEPQATNSWCTTLMHTGGTCTYAVFPHEGLRNLGRYTKIADSNIFSGHNYGNNYDYPTITKGSYVFVYKKHANLAGFTSGNGQGIKFHIINQLPDMGRPIDGIFKIHRYEELKDDFVAVYCSFDTDRVENSSLGRFVQAKTVWIDENSCPDSLIFGIVQFVAGEVEPTSLIYRTSNIAVTRAADECFVDYQLPPNKYRDLKGFNK